MLHQAERVHLSSGLQRGRVNQLLYGRVCRWVDRSLVIPPERRDRCIPGGAVLCLLQRLCRRRVGYGAVQQVGLGSACSARLRLGGHHGAAQDGRERRRRREPLAGRVVERAVLALLDGTR